MEIITALGNEKIARKIQENTTAKIIGTDIQYQEAVIEILEKNNKINLLILSSILPGELNIYEFINIIKYKNPKLEIIIILEKENNKLKEFIISKGINNIYYNNKITLDEIIEKINEINNKNKIKENKINYLENKNEIKDKIIKKIKNKLINKKILKLIKIKKYKKIKNKKIITVIGAPKVGKTIFSLIFSLIIKNKKILIIDFNKNNNIKIIIGKKIKNNIINWKKKVDILMTSTENYEKNNLNNIEKK